MLDQDYLMKKEMLRRNYSPRTISTYCQCIRNFLSKCKKDNLRKITKKDVKNYIDKYLVDKNKSGNTINVYLNAIKFLMENILNKRLMYNIRYSKVPKKLPVVLSKEEIKKLIDSIKNDKHKLMVKLLYSSGLRVSELVKLRVEDLEINENYGWVRKGKGNKDRFFIIANNLKDELVKFIPKEGFIFKGYKGHMSVRTLQEILKNSAKIAKIEKRVSPHTLRHSFATHLIENGYGVIEVQGLLGHNSSETTMIYLHTAAKKINVISPLDQL